MPAALNLPPSWYAMTTFAKRDYLVRTFQVRDWAAACRVVPTPRKARVVVRPAYWWTEK